MKWTVTVEVHAANLVKAKAVLAAAHPESHWVHTSAGGSQRLFTFTVLADSAEQAGQRAISQITETLGSLASGRPHLKEAVEDRS